MIILQNINKTFNKDKNPLVIFNNLNLTIDTNKFIAIVGRSGSGKSTLLNLIGSIEKPDSGEIIINDINITKLNDKELSKYRNEQIGYIFQSFFLEPSLSAIDNVSMPLAIRGIPLNERENIAKEILNKLGILEKAYEKTDKLSGGEKQRVCIARALITNPSIILSDEPTGQLDYETGQEILKILRNIVDEGKTVLLVTHNQEDANNYADKILRIKDGKFISILGEL